jgi:hypothetical protein
MKCSKVNTNNLTFRAKAKVIPDMVCYCFEWTRTKMREELKATGKTSALEDIKAKMVDPGCNCEVLNPSGKCCLGDVTKAIKNIKEELEL